MRFLVLLVGLAAALGCGDGETPVSPAGKVSADCSLMEILSGKEGCAEDPSLDEVPEGYVPPEVKEEEPVAEEPTEPEEPVEEEDTTEQARAELTRRGIAYTAAAFVDSARAGNLGVVQLFVEAGMWVNVADSDGNTPLHLAASAGRLEVVKYLVRQGAIVNARTPPPFSDNTPLHYAAQNGHLEVVKYLVGQGAYMNATSGTGETPLARAAADGELEVVKYLVGQGADVNATGRNGSTPLHGAALYRWLDVVKFLVEHGADLDATDVNGWTPLHAAAWGGTPESEWLFTSTIGLDGVKYLVGQGADVNATDHRGQTPRDLAEFTGQTSIVAYFDSPASAEDFEKPASAPAGSFAFRIEYRHVAGPIFNQADKDLIEQAARRWEEVIVRGGESDYALVVVAHTLDSMPVRAFGIGNYTRLDANGVPVAGIIQLSDRADGRGSFGHLALHEIGHALGLVGVGEFQDDYWLGQAFRERFGYWMLDRNGNAIPWQRRYGAHFNVFGEIMGAHDGNVSDVTELSATVLDDMGYEVDYDAVGPFPGERTINGHTFTKGDIVAKPTLPLFCGVGH